MSLAILTQKINRELQGKQCLIAVSGGVDSMVLLHLIKHLHPIVVHINHHKREDAHLDQLTVTSFCTKENLTCFVKDIVVEKGNFQDQAHALRQAIYLSIAQEYKLNYVLTAHHADDQIETIIMRILKGSAFEYQSGLKSKHVIQNIIFYKPLLEIDKHSLYAYAEKHCILYREDVTNQFNLYTRNSIRNELIPVLETISNDYKTHLLAFSKRVEDISHMLQSLAKPYIKLILSRKQLLSIDPILSQEVIRLWLIKRGCTPSKTYVHRIYKELKNKKPNLEVLIENQGCVQFSYDDISIKPLTEKNLITEKTIENSEILGHKHVSIFYDNKPNTPQPVIEICYNKLIFPLRIRYRLSGDLLSFHYGHKKLKDHLMNIKYPKHLRDDLIVLEDATHTIIYVERIYINKTLGDAHKMWVNIRTHDDT